ncbi:hypothetical protein DICA1_E07052 [Diutina catenulata]
MKRSPQKTGFKTDTDISKGQYRERELERWVPDEDTPAMTLESTGSGTWDQFKVNQEKFGVESTYDEHLYTTRINKQAPDYDERVKRADKIARDIEGSATTDRHVMEERGLSVDDSGMDEEDKYSGVDRTKGDRRGDELMAALRGSGSGPSQPSHPSGPSEPGRYVTPRQRAADYHNDPAIVSSSATKKKTPDAKDKPKKDDAGKDDDKPEESFRLNAQSEINSLREFSANFKIPHKMPNDLLPILSKDKTKQDEILKKQDKKPAGAKSASPAASKSPKKKMDPTKPAFNPKAAAFTPSAFAGAPKAAPPYSGPAYYPPPPPGAAGSSGSPTPPKNFRQHSQGHSQGGQGHNPSSGPSPRMSRPYASHGANGQGPKRHHQISAAEFFGHASRVPTKASQQHKAREFQFAFSLFVTAKERAKESEAPTVEKTFQTPPTWDSTIDVPYDKLFPSAATLSKLGAPGAGAGMMPTSPYGPNAVPAFPSKYPMSPQQAAAMAHYQQQQYHAAMMYQQQFKPGQPMPMYESPYMSPGFMPPPPQFSGGQSPVNGSNMMGQPMPYQGNAQGGGNRRYQGKNRNH